MQFSKIILTFNLLLLTTFFSTPLHAGQLEFNNPNHKKDFAIEENSFIKIWETNKLMPDHEGRFKIIDEQTIEIKEQKIALSSIQKVKINPKLNGALGIAFFVTGTAILAGGITTVATANGNSNTKITGGILIGLGALSAGIGAPAAFKRRTFAKDKGWAVSVVL